MVFSKTALHRSIILDHAIPFTLPKNFYENHNCLHYQMLFFYLVLNIKHGNPLQFAQKRAKLKISTNAHGNTYSTI